MAHDIGFYDADTKEVVTFFFGYAGGIFYEAFDAEHCDGGMSGTNRGVTRNAEQVRQALEKIKSSKIYTSYPDPDRLPDVVTSIEQYLDAHPNAKILIHYS